LTVQYSLEKKAKPYFMDIKLYSKKTGELYLDNNFPDAYVGGLRLPGATIRMSNSNECSFLFQQFQGNGFQLRFSNISSKKETQYILIDESMITLRYALYRTSRYYLQDVGSQVFHERGFNLLYSPVFSSDGILHCDAIYIIVDVIMTRAYLQPYLEGFVALTDFMDTRDLNVAARLCLHNQVANTEMMSLLDEIVDWGYLAIGKDIQLLEQMIRQLVGISLAKAKENSLRRTSKMKQPEIEKIYRLAEILYERGTTLDLKELAEKMHSSVYMLNKGFKEIYGYAMQQYNFEEKMRIALRMVKDKNYTIKQVADIIGYADPQSFIRAFKRRFGFTPRRFAA
jgi:AraC-like DNA-binding protein